MLRTDDIMDTLRMFRQENLDVRSVTLGLNLLDCADPSVESLCKKIKHKINRMAGGLVDACERAGQKYGIPVVNKRLAVTPVSAIAAGGGPDTFCRIAHTLDATCEDVGIDFVGGFSALVQKGLTDADRDLINAIPEALAETSHVCGCVNVAGTHAGINIDAVSLVAGKIKDLAARTSDNEGFGCAKLSVFANIPEDNPFMAGAMTGFGEPDSVVNIGVSGPGVVKTAIERMLNERGDVKLGEIAEQIKRTCFKVTRVGELIGREVADSVNAHFGIVDLSLAPTPRVNDSVGEILMAMGIQKVGSPGTTAALAMLNDAVKKGGLFASSSVGGLSGAFIPVSEDKVLADAAAAGHLSIEKLEAMTSVCSVGLDMVAVPGDIPTQTIAAIIADEMAIGVINRKTTSVRLIPVPGRRAGEKVVFGGLFGESIVLPVTAPDSALGFINHGGRIPAPLQALNN